MLRNQMKKYIEETFASMKPGQLQLEIFQEEKEYVERHSSILEEIDNITLIEKDFGLRFEDAYIERTKKETEELIAEENANFLQQTIDYLKKNKNEFIYIESHWFDIIGADAISLEVDDVFGTYDVMLGLKLQKKHEAKIKEYLSRELQGDAAKFDLMFSGDEGLWNVNFTLNFLGGFREDLPIGQAYSLIYRFLFLLVENVEEK